jgi:peptide/nickel transport system permease protein
MSAGTIPMASMRGRLRGWRATGWIGGILFLIIVVIAVAGPALTPFNPTAPVGIPGAGPSSAYPLGLDFLGRDVLSRVLAGGRSTFLLGLSATVLTYVLGIAVGMIAGFKKTVLDQLLMRSVDVILSLPALLVMLLAVTAFGGGFLVLICSAALVLFPGVARLVRTATLEVASRGFVDAAVARGEPTRAILWREILPNLSGPLIADVGIRFSWAIIMIAGVNYLGLGIQPPVADWGVMVSENRQELATNVWGVVAPAIMLGLLIIAVNLLGEAYTARRIRAEGGGA